MHLIMCFYVKVVIPNYLRRVFKKIIFWLFLYWFGSKLIINKKSWSRVAKTYLFGQNCSIAWLIIGTENINIEVNGQSIILQQKCVGAKLTELNASCFYELNASCQWRPPYPGWMRIENSWNEKWTQLWWECIQK